MLQGAANLPLPSEDQETPSCSYLREFSTDMRSDNSATLKHRMRRDHQHSYVERDKKDTKKKRKKIVEQVLEQTDDGKEIISTGKKRKVKNRDSENEIRSKDSGEAASEEQKSRNERYSKPQLASRQPPTHLVLSEIIESKHSMGDSCQHDHGEKDHKDKNEKTNKVKNLLLEEPHIDRDVMRQKKKKKKEKKEKSKKALENGRLSKYFDEEVGAEQHSRDAETLVQNRNQEKKSKERKEEAVEDIVEEARDSVLHKPGVIKSEGLGNDELHSKLNERKSNKEKIKEKKRKNGTFEDRFIDSDPRKHIIHVLNEPEQTENDSHEDDVEEIWGVRFTPEEDEILTNAILTYIKAKGWDKQVGLEKIFNIRKHSDARNCWADIKMSLPHRPQQAIRFRARLLLEEGSHLGKWSKEEEDLLRQLQNKHGNKWREFSSILNRQRSCIKEKWRTLKRSETVKKKGRWSQDELQQLAKAVHESLRLNRLQAKNKKLDRHILRDNIGWETIANTLGHHNHGPCCTQWYRFFESSLIAEGHWRIQDDFLLLKGLLESGASAEEEVEWDSLLEHRSGQVCLVRWKQMIKHVGENKIRQFLDTLDVLVRRYAPDLVEASSEENLLKTQPTES